MAENGFNAGKFQLVTFDWCKNGCIDGHVHKYQTHFGGFVQTVKRAIHKSRFVISPIFLTFRMLRSHQNILDRKHFGHVFAREILC